MANTILPLELIDKCIGSQITILMKDGAEFTGLLVGFDDYVNLVLSDAEESDVNGQKTRLKKCLINGNGVAMLVPGGVDEVSE